VPRRGGDPVRRLIALVLLAGCGTPAPQAPSGMAVLPEGCDAVGSGRVCTPLALVATAPVSNADYAAFVKGQPHVPPVNCCDPAKSVWEGSYLPPAVADDPVVNVTWRDADAYCTWKGRRLPTEAEWVRAVAEGVVHPAAVREWVGDRYGPPPWARGTAKDPTGPWTDTCCVVRDPHGGRARVPDHPVPELAGTGFRCATRPHEGHAPYPRGRVASGLKLVGSIGSYRYVAPDGTVAIPGPFDDAMKFSEKVDRAWVRAPGKSTWDLIDPHGTVVAHTPWVAVAPFAQGLARVGRGTYAALEGAPFGFVDRSGSPVIPPYLGFASAFSPEAVAVARDAASGRWGLLARDGSWRVPPHYAGLGFVANGRVPALLDEKTGRWGWIDAKGEPTPSPPPTPVAWKVPEGDCAGLHSLLAHSGPRAADLWIGVEPEDGPRHEEWRIRRYAGGASSATRLRADSREVIYFLPGLSLEQGRALAAACAPEGEVHPTDDGVRIAEPAESL